MKRLLFWLQSSWASDEVTQGRLVSLEGFSFVFRAKNEGWRDRQLVRWHLEVEWRKLSVPFRPKESYVCVSLASKEQIKFVYSVLKWLQAKILNENWRYRVAKKRPKLVWILIWSPKRRNISSGAAKFTFDKHFVLKLCRQNETVVGKILEVRESFESLRVQQRRDRVRKKYM